MSVIFFQYFILKLAFVVNLSCLYAVGYSTCHWCHVMERESFESEEIAQILNDKFVSVKVDREERPDVDKVYMTYIQVKSKVQKLELLFLLCLNITLSYC